MHRCNVHPFSPAQVSSTHQRLFLELTDMAESDQNEMGAEDDADGCAADSGDGGGNGRRGGGGNHFNVANESSVYMKDWVLVAAGLERFFFVLYTIVFAVVASVYV